MAKKLDLQKVSKPFLKQTTKVQRIKMTEIKRKSLHLLSGYNKEIVPLKKPTI